MFILLNLYFACSGLYIRYNTLTLDGGITIHVEKVVQNSYFNATTHEYDVSMIKTEKELMLNQTNANNIQLAAEPVKYGSPINITGWGDLEDMPGDFSYKLQIAQLEIVDQNECNKKLGGRVTDKMFCAKSNKTNICSSYGDIGGPSVISNLLCGILITWYDACKQNAGYEVFTDLYNFYFWINMVVAVQTV